MATATSRRVCDVTSMATPSSSISSGPMPCLPDQVIRIAGDASETVCFCGTDHLDTSSSQAVAKERRRTADASTWVAARGAWPSSARLAVSRPASCASSGRCAPSPSPHRALRATKAEVQKTSALPRCRSGNSQRVSDLRSRVTVSGWQFETVCARRIVPRTNKRLNFRRKLEAPPGFEPGMEVLQIS